MKKIFFVLITLALIGCDNKHVVQVQADVLKNIDLTTCEKYDQSEVSHVELSVHNGVREKIVYLTHVCESGSKITKTIKK